MKCSIIRLLTAFVFTISLTMSSSFKIPSFRKHFTSSLISVSLLTGQPHLVSSLTIPLDSNPTFQVEKASANDIKSLNVASWSTWSSSDNPKYAVHKVKAKEYEVNEVCYIDKGKFLITPDNDNDGKAVTVQAGDFVVFPKGFTCTWEVIEPVNKHWLEY